MTKKLRIQIPEPFEIRVVNPDGTPKLDDNKKPVVQTFTARVFAQNAMGTCDEFTKKGPAGLAAWVRVDDAILAGMDSGVGYFDLYDVDAEPLIEHIKNPPGGVYHAQDILGPRVMNRFVVPWLNATEVAQEIKEAAE